MQNQMMRAMFGMALAAVVGAALAQGMGGPGRPGGPGMGPGGPGMGQGMRAPRGNPAVMLVRRPDVQAELRMTEAQREAVQTLRGGRGPGGGPGRGPGGPGGPGRPGGPDPAMERLSQILNEGQLQRLRELVLQWEGPVAIGREDVADRVGLTDEQLDQVRDTIRANMPPPPGGPGGPGGPGMGRGGAPRGDTPGMRAAREAAGRRVLALLTSAQKSRWESLLGRAFRFQ